MANTYKRVVNGHELIVEGGNLKFKNLFSYPTTVLVINPTTMNPTSVVNIDGSQVLTQDLDLPTASNYLDTAWATGGWSIGQIDKQISTFVSLNTPSQHIFQNRNYVLIQSNIGGLNYTMAFVYIGDHGILTEPSIVATGGVITTDGNYKIHTFNGSGTFEVLYAPAGSTVDYLLVGGGGSGGSFGGGGAGGIRSGTNLPITNGQLPVVVGAGGALVAGGVGNPGQNSTFSGLTAIGGGRGGSGSAGASNQAGLGGSGGGGTGLDFVGDPGPGTPGQGNYGGIGYANGAGTAGAGGGGGGGADIVGTVRFWGTGTLVAGGAQNVMRITSTANLVVGDIVQLYNNMNFTGRTVASIINGTDFTVTPGHGVSSADLNIDVRILSAGSTVPGNGKDAVSTVAGNGGAGRTSSITGAPVVYGGGGGGGSYIFNSSGTAGIGGTGGGGNGGRNGLAAQAGTANRGGGGGAGGLTSAGHNNGNTGAGGSGVVIIRYQYQ